MFGMLILLGLLAGLIALDLAALRWAVDSRDCAVHPGTALHRRGTCDE